MFKIILTVLLTVIGVLFTLNNLDHVPMSFLLGQPVQVRLIFIILVSIILGFLIRHFIGVAREEELKKRLLMERKRRSQNGRFRRDEDINLEVE